jgi:hypothetical protein
MSVPEGHAIIAQRFNVGAPITDFISPEEGTAERLIWYLPSPKPGIQSLTHSLPLASSSQFCQQTEDFQVQPNQGDEQ